MDDVLVAGIRDRYLKVIDQIDEATTRSGRKAGAVRLVVVTKSQPLEVVRATIAAGATILGENYAEEAILKISALQDSPVEWHMIGHVQSRKAEMVARNFAMLHSLDSLKLAVRLNRTCLEIGRKLSVLMEVNVSGEESKFGFPGWNESQWMDLLPILEQILTLPGLVLHGLMTMPPLDTDLAKTRPFFQRLRNLKELLKERLPRANWSDLSMGTSADYIAAVEEGATIVRVGQAILGPRPA